MIITYLLAPVLKISDTLFRYTCKKIIHNNASFLYETSFLYSVKSQSSITNGDLPKHTQMSCRLKSGMCIYF